MCVEVPTQRRCGGLPHGIAAVLALFLFPGVAPAQDWIYTVVDGDNLWNFSARYLDTPLRSEQLQRLNNIPNDRRMRPGSTIRVPMEWVPPDTPVPAQVEAYNGAVTVVRADGSAETVAGPTTLYLGDRVRCASAASLAIRFADGTLLTLHEDSELRLDRLSAYGETGMVDSRLNLLRGRAETRARPAVGPGSRFQIETPSAISAVRGTEYRTVVDEDRGSRVEVLGGQVSVAAAKQELVVDPGFGTRVAPGAAPAPPVALLPAPARLHVDDAVASRRPSIRWSAVPGAAGYRVELAREARFLTILWQSTPDIASASPPLLDEGDYFLRVRGIDGGGLEGLPLQAPLTIAPAPPLEPVATTLEPRGEEVWLTWVASAPGLSFEAQLSEASDFGRLLETQRLADTSFRVDFTGRTERFVRVRAIDARGTTGPWGPVQTVAGTPEPPPSSLRLYLQSLGVMGILAAMLL